MQRCTQPRRAARHPVREKNTYFAWLYPIFASQLSCSELTFFGLPYWFPLQLNIPRLLIIVSPFALHFRFAPLALNIIYEENPVDCQRLAKLQGVYNLSFFYLNIWPVVFCFAIVRGLYCNLKAFIATKTTFMFLFLFPALLNLTFCLLFLQAGTQSSRTAKVTWRRSSPATHFSEHHSRPKKAPARKPARTLTFIAMLAVKRQALRRHTQVRGLTPPPSRFRCRDLLCWRRCW